MDEIALTVQKARRMADEDARTKATHPNTRLSLAHYIPPRMVEITTPIREIIIRDRTKRGAHGYGIMSSCQVTRFDQESMKTIKAAAQLVGDTSMASFIRQATLHMAQAILEDFAEEVQGDRIDVKWEW